MKYSEVKQDLKECPESGAYAVLMQQTKTKTIKVGRLGRCLFPKGFYVYSGRASRGLGKRLNRHLTKEKKLRWHVDYLTCDKEVRIEDIFIFPHRAESECDINQALQKMIDGRQICPGFGASDCRSGCGSHLIYSKVKPDWTSFEV